MGPKWSLLLTLLSWDMEPNASRDFHRSTLTCPLPTLCIPPSFLNYSLLRLFVFQMGYTVNKCRGNAFSTLPLLPGDRWEIQHRFCPMNSESHHCAGCHHGNFGVQMCLTIRAELKCTLFLLQDKSSYFVKPEFCFVLDFENLCHGLDWNNWHVKFIICLLVISSSLVNHLF